MGALLGLLPLIGTVLPHLIPALATPLAGNILSKAGDVAMKIFGTIDAEKIQLQIEQEHDKLERFKAELEAATASEKMAYDDLASARGQTVSLVEQGSLIAWGAPVMSVIITVGFLITLYIFLHNQLQLAEFQQSVLNIMLGFLGAAFQQTVNYWLGSTRSSANKDATLANLAVNTVPTNVANAMASKANDNMATALKAASNGNGHR